MADIDLIKRALRIDGTDIYDAEIKALIEACEADMIQSGISAEKVYSNNNLITIAKMVYVKAYFGYNNPDADALKDDYADRIKKMALLSEYRG